MAMFSSSRLAVLQAERNTMESSVCLLFSPNQKDQKEVSQDQKFLCPPSLKEQAEQLAGADGDHSRAGVSLHHLHDVDVEAAGEQQRAHFTCRQSRTLEDQPKKKKNHNLDRVKSTDHKIR